MPLTAEEIEVLPPSQRQRAIEAEAALDRAREAQNGQPAGQPQPATTAGNEPPPVEPVAPPIEPEPPAPAEPTPAGEEAEPPAQQSPEAPQGDLEQRYRTLEGMYKADTRRMRGEIQELRRIIDAQSQALQNLNAAGARAPTGEGATPATPPPGGPRFVTTQDKERFEEVADMTEGAVARGVEPVGKAVDQVRKELDEMRQRAFYERLDGLEPDWEKTHDTPQFQEFLTTTDDVTGQTFDVIIRGAEQSRDPRRVAAVFRRFKQASGNSPGSPASIPLTRQAQRPTNERELATPPRQRGTPPPVPGKKIWPIGELKELQRELSIGRYDNRPAERDKLQKEIEMAIAEGRVTK